MDNKYSIPVGNTKKKRSRYYAPTVSMAQVAPLGRPMPGNKPTKPAQGRLTPPASPISTSVQTRADTPTKSDSDSDSDAKVEIAPAPTAPAATPTAVAATPPPPASMPVPISVPMVAAARPPIRRNSTSGVLPKARSPGGILTERESLLIWASAKASFSMSMKHFGDMTRAPAATSTPRMGQSVNVTLVQLSGRGATGLPDLVSLDVKPDTSVRDLREQLQCQLQDLLDRYQLGKIAEGDPAFGKIAKDDPAFGKIAKDDPAFGNDALIATIVERPIIAVLGIYNAENDAALTHALLDSNTRFPSELGATVAIKYVANQHQKPPPSQYKFSPPHISISTTPSSNAAVTPTAATNK